MNKFNIFIPFEKGTGSKSYSKLVEVVEGGEKKTRYEIPGVASTTALDRDVEIVSRECLQKMADFINSKKLPIFGNHEHSWENMIGYTDSAELDGDELRIKLKTAFEEYHPKISQLVGDLDAELPLSLSIGGKVKKFKEVFNPKINGKVKVIDEVDLLETSIVGIGANPDAYLSLPAQIAKSLIKYPPAGGLPEKGRKLLRQVYRDYKRRGFSDERAARAAWGAVRNAGYETGEEKSLKEEILVEEITKSAGQAGVASYGKLGETTPMAMCPTCGRPSEFREVKDGSSHFYCVADGTRFTVALPTKTNETASQSQPLRPEAKPIDEQTQSVLGKKSIGGLSMAKKRKDAEAEAEARCKDAEAEGEAEGEAESEAESEAEADAEYKRFVSHMARYQKEMATKAEGIDTVPGGEQAKPQYTIGGSGGAAKPVHAKSVKDFEVMKKAISENFGVEGLEKANEIKEAKYDFIGMRSEQLRKGR